MRRERLLRSNRIVRRCRRTLGSVYWLLSPAVRGRARPAGTADPAAVVPFEGGARIDAAADAAVCVVCHLFYVDLASGFRTVLEGIERSVDVFVSTDTEEKRIRIEAAFHGFAGGEVTVRTVPNRGRDIAPKFVTFGHVYARYEYALFVHGKRSTTSDMGDRWRESLLNALAGDPDVVTSILCLFETDRSIGIVMPRNFAPVRGALTWGHNFGIARSLATRMGVGLTKRHALDFPAGSMFWARTAALAPLLGLALRYEDFPIEKGQTRMTLQHAMERLVLYACEVAGYRWVKVVHRDETGEADLWRIRDEADLHAFLDARQPTLIDAP